MIELSFLCHNLAKVTFAGSMSSFNRMLGLYFNEVERNTYILSHKSAIQVRYPISYNFRECLIFLLQLFFEQNIRFYAEFKSLITVDINFQI